MFCTIPKEEDGVEMLALTLYDGDYDRMQGDEYAKVSVTRLNFAQQSQSG